MTEISSQLSGEFTGYHDGAVFRLSNGQVWQQRRYKYKYCYKYRPRVRIYQTNGTWMAEFDCMEEAIEVVRAELIEEGPITSEFKGFHSGARFTFANGRVWEQAEPKHSYHYAHRPQALVVHGINGIELHIEGMDDYVTVRRA